MKYKITCMVIIFMLLISFSAYAISFNPEETYNSVVVVYTGTGVGSGFYVKENIILTNSHVVGKHKNVEVRFYDGTEVDGTVIKADEDKDMALIQVNKAMTPLNINTENISIGQEVYAIGAPKDMPYTMTKGIISALDRKLGQNSYIQIDASVNSGNSGGPLVDENGNVIGVITLKASDAEGIGFAISADEVKSFVEGTTIPDFEPSSENGEKDSPAKNKGYKFVADNTVLKIALCVSVLLNIVLGVLYLFAMLKKRPPQEKDEFDFEIEIEE